jgi:hypothetical protein
MLANDPRRLLALIARSLRCSDSVRLQRYFHRPAQPVTMSYRPKNRSWLRAPAHGGTGISTLRCIRLRPVPGAAAA